jgi:FkbM family methyltransferase
MRTITTRYGFTLSVNDPSVMSSVVAAGAWEAAESEAVLRLVDKGDVVIDCGANIGYYTCLLAQRGALVLAIEPNQQAASLLIKNVGDNKLVDSVRFYGGAASSANGLSSFYVAPDDVFSSLHHEALSPLFTPTTVTTWRLDTLMPPDCKFKLLKTDTEGAEMLVLEGLGERIADVENILIELNDAHLKPFGTSAALICDYLSARGMRFVEGFGENQLWGRR